MISLAPQALGLRSFQTVEVPSFARKGDRWIYPITGEELTWYVDPEGVGAFVEFGDGAFWIDSSETNNQLLLVESPSLNQIIIHGKRKWRWNGKFWRTVYSNIVRGGTFND